MAWQASVEAQPADAEFTDARVTDVVDGDTIDVSPPVQGVDRVRLIGVDTPEVFGEEEPCGPEASAFTEEQLAGEQIQLEFDEDKKDQYNRALAYVWRGDELFNETLVQQGYAEVLTIAPNDKYADCFLATQEQAEAEGVGSGVPAAARPLGQPPSQLPPHRRLRLPNQSPSRSLARSPSRNLRRVISWRRAALRSRLTRP